MNENKTQSSLCHAGLALALMAASAVLPVASLAADASSAERLARAKYCMTCHGIGGTIVGPGYRQIAARRAGEPDAESVLVARILGGSSGQWGDAIMPPNAVSEDEARLLARWILSMAPSGAAAQDKERRDESAR